MRSETSAAIRAAVEAHQFASTSSSRNGITRHHAGCTCNPAIEFEWYEREALHRDHLYAAIFAAGRDDGRDLT